MNPIRPASPRVSAGRLAFLAMVAILPVLGFGALTWETRQISLVAKPGDKSAVGVFRFKNAGDRPIAVDRIVSSCGCTSAELEKRDYAPGESGEIKAVFTFGGATGQLEKTLRVTSVEAGTSTTETLRLQVDIPELISYSSRQLLWRTSEEPVEKSVTISFGEPRTVRTLEASSTNAPVAITRIKTVADGKRYELMVRPQSLAQPVTAAISMVATFTDGTTYPVVVYFLVR